VGKDDHDVMMSMMVIIKMILIAMARSQW